MEKWENIFDIILAMEYPLFIERSFHVFVDVRAFKEIIIVFIQSI